MKFVKMQGLGNDFVVVEETTVEPADVRRWCDRRLGIGADGVLAVDPAPTMRYWNADGTVAEMCGNGLRCVARYAVDRGWAGPAGWFEIATPVGARRARVADGEVTVELGRVDVGTEVTIDGRSFRRASVGNPHAVTVVDDLTGVDVEGIGHALNRSDHFPQGVNVGFAMPSGAGSMRLRVWERGVGETLACGSGIVVAAAVIAGSDAGSVQVTVPGGVATVTFEDGVAYLTGPAEYVFGGTLAPGVSASAEER